jgi:hypothetical protein
MKRILFAVLFAACSDATPVVGPPSDTAPPPSEDTATAPDADLMDGAELGPDDATAEDSADASDAGDDLGADASVDSTADGAEDSSAEPDDTGPPDATDASPPEPPLFDLIGSVELELRPANQWVTYDETRLAAAFRDRTYVDNYVEHARVGACTLYLEDAATACEPACAPEEACQRDGTCHPFPQGASAGPIKLVNRTRGDRPVTLAVVEGDPWVYYEDQLLPRAFFSPGDRLEVDAEGAALPSFSAVVEGVGPLTLTSGDTLDMGARSDLEVAWKPAGDNSKIEMILNAGWHGRPPVGVLRCAANDAEGRIVIDASLIADLPYCAGVCLFQHPNWIERQSRVFVDTPVGRVSVTAMSRARLMYAFEGP